MTPDHLFTYLMTLAWIGIAGLLIGMYQDATNDELLYLNQKRFNQ